MTDCDGKSSKVSNLGSTPFIARSVVKKITQARPASVARSHARNNSSMTQIMSPDVLFQNKQRPMTSKNVSKGARYASATRSSNVFRMDSVEKQQAKAHKDRISKLNNIQKAMKGGEEIPKRKSKKRVVTKVVPQKTIFQKQKTEVIDNAPSAVNPRMVNSFTFSNNVSNENSLVNFTPNDILSSNDQKPKLVMRKSVPKLNLPKKVVSNKPMEMKLFEEPKYFNGPSKKRFTDQQNRIMHHAFADLKFQQQKESTLKTQIIKAAHLHKNSMRKCRLLSCSYAIKKTIKTEVIRLYDSIKGDETFANMMSGKKLNILNEFDQKKLQKIMKIRLKEKKNRRIAQKRRVKTINLAAMKLIGKMGIVFKKNFGKIDRESEVLRR